MIEYLSDVGPGLVRIGPLALATGLAGLASLLFAILAFAFGRQIGRIGDVLVALTSVLGAGVAMVLFPELRAIDSDLATIAFGLALAGGFVSGFGAILSATEATGWFLAQMHVAAGFALTGGWLVMINITARAADIFPNRAVNMGLFAGVVMLLGVTSIPALMTAPGSEQDAPWISRHVGRAGYLGWSILYPIWCIWLGQSRL